MFLTSMAAFHPAEARTNWYGRIVFDAVSGSPCTDDGFDVGSNYASSFLPSGIDGNGDSSFLGFYSLTNAYSVGVSGRFAPRASYAGVKITSAGSNFAFSGKVASFKMSPATITATTPTLTITAKIADWADPGCTVTLTGVYALRP